jgi:hypothetical protein
MDGWARQVCIPERSEPTAPRQNEAGIAPGLSLPFDPPASAKEAG